jgi:hypothetical protein
MAISNDSQLTDFLTYFNSTPITSKVTPAQKAAGLMKFFVSTDTPNSSPPPSNFPCLGITDHGPGFFNVVQVTAFFTQLFMTFPDMQWLSPPPGLKTPRLTATNEIGIQMTVTGTYSAQWFKKGHYSLPLSQLPDGVVGSPLGARQGDHTGTPAFAVFTFDGSKSCLMYQLQIYLDRYAMMQSIDIDWVPDPDSSTKMVEAVKTRTGKRITITIED